MTNSTLSGNTASDCGGGIYNHGTATLTNSTLPSAQPRPSPRGTAESIHPVEHGHNGGINNTATLTLTNSTLSNNSALAVRWRRRWSARRRHLQLRHGDAEQLHPLGQLGLELQRRRHREWRHGDADADQLHPVEQLGPPRRRRHRERRHGDAEADQLHPFGQLGPPPRRRHLQLTATADAD